jgi:hypothetical protein
LLPASDEPIGLDHWKFERRRAEREGFVDLYDFDSAQMEIPSPGVLLGVLWSGRLWNSKERRLAYQEPERNLARSGVMGVGDSFQHAAALWVDVRKVPMAERAITDNCGVMPFTPWENKMFNRALLKMVENLVAGETALIGDLLRFSKVGHIEVAHAPGEDLSLALKLLKRRNGVLQWVVAAPVEEVAVQPVSLEPGE